MIHRPFALCAALALPAFAQIPGMDLQTGNPADARMAQLLNAKQWPALADHFEALAPKDRERNLSTYLTALYRAERWARLLELCPSIVERFAKDPVHPPVLARQYLAIAHARTGQPAEAIRVYLAAGGPRDLENALGVAANSRDFPLLLQTAEEVLTRKPSLAQAGAMKGEALAKLLRPAEAEPFLMEAVLRLPQHASSWCNLAYCQQERGALAEALASAERALALDPKLIEARFNKARALMALQRYPEAREELSAGLALEPTPETRTNLETVLGQVDRYLEGQKRKAERVAQKAATHPKGRKRPS